VAEVIPGFAFKSEWWRDSGIPVIRIKNILEDCTIDTSDVAHIEEAQLTSKLRKFFVEDGDILIAMTGATAGKTARFLGSKPMLVNQRVARIVAREIDADFLWAVLGQREYQRILFHLADGAAQPNMSGGQIEEMEIPHPSPEVQRKIGRISRAYDDLIGVNARRIAIPEEIARRIFDEWFVHGSDLSDAPSQWEVRPLFDIARVAYGKNLPSKDLVADGPYPVYGAAKIIGQYNEYTRQQRTLICGCRGSVGVMQITEPRCFVTNNSFAFDPLSADDFFWLFHSLRNRGLHDVVGGSAQPQITLDSISSVELSVPPPALRCRFQSVSAPMYDFVWSLEKQNKVLRASRDLLLPKLISGEIDLDGVVRDVPKAAKCVAAE